jgi:hypothetical protein
LKKAERSSNVNARLTRKRDLIVQLIEHLEKELKVHMDAARSGIQAKVNQILEGAAAQRMKISISEDFRISVKIADRTRALSKGQQQLVGLVFLGALVYFCKLRANTSGSMLLPGTIAPLILDAPFSQMDDVYQPEAAKVLPELSQQLILMVSGSQSSPHVLEHINPFVGKEFVINRHNTAPSKPGDKAWAITLRGKEYVRNNFGMDSDSSYIEEVN